MIAGPWTRRTVDARSFVPQQKVHVPGAAGSGATSSLLRLNSVKTTCKRCAAWILIASSLLHPCLLLLSALHA